MDQFDRAQELEAEERDQAIADQLAKSCHGMGLSHCEDCGEAISEQRQKAVPGCRRCVDCQSSWERFGRSHR